MGLPPPRPGEALFPEGSGSLAGVAAEKKFSVLTPLRWALSRASATAWGSTSTPMTRPAAFAMARVMVPAAVQIQDGVGFLDFCTGNGQLIQPLRLVVVHLVKGPGRQPEGEAAQGIFNQPGPYRV